MMKAENVEMVVMVTDKSRLPLNMMVQMFEAPPPGLQPRIEVLKIKENCAKLLKTFSAYGDMKLKRNECISPVGQGKYISNKHTCKFF